MLDHIENFIPYVLPVLGGLLGMVYVNLHEMDQLNPMYWVGGGIILGFIAARLAVNVIARLR